MTYRKRKGQLVMKNKLEPPMLRCGQKNSDRNLKNVPVNPQKLGIGEKKSGGQKGKGKEGKQAQEVNLDPTFIYHHAKSGKAAKNQRPASSWSTPRKGKKNMGGGKKRKRFAST